MQSVTHSIVSRVMRSCDAETGRSASTALPLPKSTLVTATIETRTTRRRSMKGVLTMAGFLPTL
jgi:hypothetical protein